MATTVSVTPESIEKAKAARDAERRAVERATGLRITEDGRMTPRACVIHCPRPGCRFSASARSEGRAVQGIVTHLVKGHMESEARS